MLACTRQAVTAVGHRLCHPHGKQLNNFREEGPVDEQVWLRTAPSGCNGAEISFRGLPDLIVAQLLFGLQYRCRRGAKTDVGGVRSLIDRTIRPSQAAGLEDVPKAGVERHRDDPPQPPDRLRAVGFQDAGGGAV
ncbi:hypothetical protein ACFTY8_31910 [Streptomyces mirabilis]|uniref:hypothetical protein n=1 Tax=Streptomyces mirabilis TaxID=68239 RepID=UPI00363B0121